MADRLLLGAQINPDGWYSDMDLVLMGIQQSVQQQARQAGRLQSVQVGAGYQYKGQWLTDWLNAGAPTEPEARRSADRAPTVHNRLPVSRSAGDESTSSYDAAAIEAFEQAVAKRTRAGMARADAVLAVASQDPQLHRIYLIATNRDRPEVVRQLQDQG